MDQPYDPPVTLFFWEAEVAEPTRLERLEKDRDWLEAAMVAAEPHQLAPLVREHRIVLSEIESLAKPKEGSTRDQLAAQRAKRKPATPGAASS